MNYRESNPSPRRRGKIKEQPSAFMVQGAFFVLRLKNLFRTWKHFVSPVKQSVSAGETTLFSTPQGEPWRADAITSARRAPYRPL